MEKPAAEHGRENTNIEPAYVERRKVGREGVVIAPDRVLEGTPEAQAEIARLIGGEAPVVAGVRAGETGDQFLIVDTSALENYNTPYVLLADRGGQKGIWPDQALTIGRNHHKDRFNHSPGVSREHFTLRLDSKTGQLHLYDDDSGNGTYVTGEILPEQRAPKVRVSDGYSIRAKEAVGIYPDYFGERAGTVDTYEGHPIVDRNSTSLKNGVYGTRHLEWIVVDEDSERLQATIDETLGKIETVPHDRRQRERILRTIEQSVAQALRYDLNATTELSAPHFDRQGLINLSDYLEAGVGVCRQQALLAGRLIEAAIDGGYLEGTLGVERNALEKAEAGHAWAVFKPEGHDELIVDPAQHFVGTREQARQRGLYQYALSTTA